MACASLVGCSTGGSSSASGRAYRQGEMLTDPWADLGYRLDWRGFPVLTGRRGAERANVFDIGILVQDTQNTVTLMDYDTGRNLWVTQVGRPTTRFVGNGVYEDSVLICSDNEIYFLDAQTGTITDRQSIAVVVNTPPVVLGETAVFGSATGEVVGHSLYSGFKLWGYMLGGSMQAPPVAIGERVGAVSEAGDVLFVRPENGTSTGRASIFGGLDNRPVADARTMYVASVDQSVYAFAGDDGRRVWRYRAESPISAQPAVVHGMLCVTIPGEGLVALDALTGERQWSNADLSGEVIGSLGDELLFWDGATLHALSADTGEPTASVPVTGAQRVFCSPVEDGDLYVVSRDAVAKYSPR
jgi:outer membrane protein assembly factor BamB